MQADNLVAVTGAYGYTGKYITERLLQHSYQVITLTGHPNRPNPFGDRVKAFPFNFDAPDILQDNLQGVRTLYNTYWIRFSYGEMTYQRAIDNTLTMFRAAERAGVERIVHTSISNPSSNLSPPYFHGKWLLEKEIKEFDFSHAIVRPTVIFGKEDILINNIAYLLRKFPIFFVPGSGEYRLQPIYVRDMAALAVDAGKMSDDLIVDAAGPEVYTFNQLVRLIAKKIGASTSLIHVPASLALVAAKLIGYMVGDVLLTQDELKGLMNNLLVSKEPPQGSTSLDTWLEENRDEVGHDYASELERHYKN